MADRNSSPDKNREYPCEVLMKSLFNQASIRVILIVSLSLSFFVSCSVQLYSGSQTYGELRQFRDEIVADAGIIMLNRQSRVDITTTSHTVESLAEDPITLDVLQWMVTEAYAVDLEDTKVGKLKAIEAFKYSWEQRCETFRQFAQALRLNLLHCSQLDFS
jgi:hypothetical protein